VTPRLRTLAADGGHQIQIPRQLPESRHGPEAASPHRGRGKCALPQGHQVIDLAQVDLVDIAGPAIHAGRADRVVAGMAADEFAHEAAAQLGTPIARDPMR
jgi:hypothetical protein